MESNPYAACPGLNAPELPGEPIPLWRKGLRLLGATQFLEAGLEAICIVASVEIMAREGVAGFRIALFNPVFQDYLVERLVVLPALIVLTVSIGLGLIKMRSRHARLRLILSAVVTFWAFHTALSDLEDLQNWFRFFDQSRLFYSYKITGFVTKFGAGLAHAVVVVFLFRIKGRLRDRETGDVDTHVRGPGLGEYLLGLVPAIFLAIGTVRTASWLVHQVFDVVR